MASAPHRHVAHRTLSLGVVALLVAVAAVTASTRAAASTRGGAETARVVVNDLRADYLRDPIAIDDRTPALSWTLSSPGSNTVQQAYQIQAATSSQKLNAGHPDLWDSGQVAGAATTGITYAGAALASREGVYWRVRIWDGHGHSSSWSTISHWGMGLLNPTDWNARWITENTWADHSSPHPVAVKLPPQDTRYVRLDVTKLGLPLLESGFGYPVSRLQLAEIAVVDSAHADTDLALGAPVQASENYSVPGAWEPSYLTDGQLTSSHGTYGYTSFERRTQDLGSSSIWVQLDLGSIRHIDEVLLYPRTDLQTADGKTPNFPVDYTVQTADNAAGPFTIAARVVGQQPPSPPGPEPQALPMFVKQFALTGQVAQARLYMTGLGMFDATLNGHAVSDAVLQPPNTDYQQRVIYATYDVSRSLRQGNNALGVMLGNGLYNVPATPGRYEKLTRSDGPPKLLAQLEITYRDGRREVISSDESWKVRLGPVTFSNWYGGEDVDARRAQPGWDLPGADLAGWGSAVTAPPPSPHTVLSAQMVPPVRVVDTVRPVAITQPKPGVYVADFGHQLAGWEQLRVSGAAGTTVTIRPAERLATDGTALQDGGTGKPFWDTYVLAGGGVETWHPRFEYHGFRYLQFDGLPHPPTSGSVTALVLRTDNEVAGTFTSSSGLLNGIHQMIGQAVSSNTLLYGSDPNREKLGWLADYAFEFGAINRDFDAAAYYRLLVRDMADAQTSSGLVPDIAPEYTVFGGAFRDDPNWGSAIITVPWDLYQTYGDTSTIADYYPTMQRYFDYLSSKAQASILDYGLGEWGTLDPSVPKAFTATWAYHRDATLLAAMARVLGKNDDATHYDSMAGTIAAAFNGRFFDATKNTYTGGSESVDALALDGGLVPADHRQQVLDHLVATLHQNHEHVTTGMIALPSLFRVLSDGGRDDVVYAIATATDYPSYGWLLANGETSMTEFWQAVENPAGSEHNMFILGALEEWFTRGVGGIRPDGAGALAGADLTIRPAVVGALRQANSMLNTVHGVVSTQWRRSNNDFTLAVTVPANVRATVWVPLLGSQRPIDAPLGAQRVGDRPGAELYDVGSGTWRFHVTRTPPPPPAAASMWIKSPTSPVTVVSGLPATASFTLANLGTRAVTVHPKVTVSAGFDAVASPRTLRLAPLQGAVVTVTIVQQGQGPTTGTLTLAAGDATADVAVATTDNVLRAASLSASSTYPGFPVTTLNDGDTSTTAWCGGQAGHGWNDATAGAFPDDVTATFPTTLKVDHAVIYTLSRSTCQYGGVSDVDIQANIGGSWHTVAVVRGNSAARVDVAFPTVAATALRFHILDSTSHDYSRLVELEASDS